MEKVNRRFHASRRFSFSCVVVVLIAWAFIVFDLSNAQALPVFTETGSRNIYVAGANPDSLELKLLDIEIQKAEEIFFETTFWKRIIPQVHLSGNFGVRDIIFINPTAFTPYILPRDAYRLSVSLSLNEIFNFSKHTLAELELERLSTERSHWLEQRSQLRRSLQQQLAELDDQLEVFQEELSIVQELLRFNQLRFEQGKIEFDSLMRTKLELLGTRKAIKRIQHLKAELELKLPLGKNSQEQ